MNTNPVRSVPKTSRTRSRRNRGFTMFEVLIVIIALGLLAALAVPTIDRLFGATGDTTKTHNANMMNRYFEALHNAGVDTSTYADGASAIAALRAGVTIPATVPGGQTQEVKLKQAVNPAAYTFTAGTATKPPTFAPILNDNSVRP